MELVLKYRCGPATANTDAEELLLSVYYDPFCTMLAETWRLSIHTMHRVDVSPVFGDSEQPANFGSLLIRDTLPSRIVQCWQPSTTDAATDQSLKFQQQMQTLTGTCLNEVKFQARPLAIGDSSRLVNVVDVERRLVVSGWVVKMHAQPPQATKEFDIALPCNRTVHKVRTHSINLSATYLR